MEPDQFQEIEALSKKDIYFRAILITEHLRTIASQDANQSDPNIEYNFKLSNKLLSFTKSGNLSQIC